MVSKTKKAKTTKTTSKKFVKPHNPPKRVRRVNPDTSVKSADVVAGILGMDELARELTVERPKTVVPDFEKTLSGQTKAIHERAVHLSATDTDYLDEYYNIKEKLNTESLLNPPDDDSLEDLVNQVRAQSALEKIEKMENLVAEATKSYWQAKRRLVLVTKVLNSVYTDMERSEIKTVEFSKEDTRKIVTEILEKSFPERL